MAGYPPPYPPPSGAPYGFDARQQARIVKQQMQAQARAQKAAFRAQREFYRRQARAFRRTSILGPLLVVVIGIVLLLIRLDRISFSEFAFLYGRWWPLLFVAAGIVLLLEWAFDHHRGQDGMPFVQRSTGGGGVFLLILLGLTGASIQTFHVNHPFPAGWHIDGDNLGEVFGDRREYEQEIDQPFPAGTTLNIDNPHGDVTIVGKSGDNKIHIVVNKQVYSWDASDLSNRADKISPRVNLYGGSMNISVPALDAAQADLAITLPDSAQTTVNANHGDVNVSDMHAPVNVTSNHGDVELDRIISPVTIHISNNGSSVSTHAVQGDVILRGHADDLNITEVSGAVSLEGEFWGNTHLEHLDGTVNFRTGRTQFSLGKLAGMVDISPDEELTGSQIVGPIELRTRSRNISFERISGNVDIINSNGTIDLTNSAPLGNVSVDNKQGAVSITVPEHTGIVVDAETTGGEVRNDLSLTPVTADDRSTLRGTVGNGAAHLIVHTTHADITIHHGAVEPPSVNPPQQPPLATSPNGTPVHTPPARSAPKHKVKEILPAKPATPPAPAVASPPTNNL